MFVHMAQMWLTIPHMRLLFATYHTCCYCLQQLMTQWEGIPRATQFSKIQTS
jgi:hypothetical protein